MDDGGHAVPVPADAPVRDPVHGVGHRDADGRTFAVRGRAGSARPLVGSAGLVEHGLGVERSASARRHASARRRPADPRSAPDRRRLHPAAGRVAGRAADGVGAGNVRRQRLTAGNVVGAEPGDVTATVDDQGPCTGAAHRRRRPGEPVPARLGDCHHRRTAAPVSAGSNGTATSARNPPSSARVCTATRRKMSAFVRSLAAADSA